MARKKRVLIAFHLINADSIAALNGVIRFIRNNRGWETQLVLPPMTLTENDIREAEVHHLDGLLINHPLGDDLSEFLRVSSIPLAAIGSSDEVLNARQERIIFSETDGESIGRMAAEYFVKLGGRRTFAFLGDAPPTHWSQMRLTGYREALKRLGHEVHVLREPLADSLAALPQPAAILLAGDYHASRLYAAAAAAHVRIPEEISVLGVDNNPFICDSITPSLSSIDRDTERQGYETACALDRLMRRPRDRHHPTILRIPPSRIVERLSTTFVSPVTTLLERANAYMDAYALKGISATDVAEHCGVSQSLLALRFRQYEHITIREKLLTLRLAEARRLLNDGRQKIELIAKRCGFKSANRLSHLFIERYGLSPRTYRAQSFSPHAAFPTARANSHPCVE